MNIYKINQATEGLLKEGNPVAFQAVGEPVQVAEGMIFTEKHFVMKTGKFLAFTYFKGDNLTLHVPFDAVSVIDTEDIMNKLKKMDTSRLRRKALNLGADVETVDGSDRQQLMEMIIALDNQNTVEYPVMPKDLSGLEDEEEAEAEEESAVGPTLVVVEPLSGPEYRDFRKNTGFTARDYVLVKLPNEELGKHTVAELTNDVIVHKIIAALEGGDLYDQMAVRWLKNLSAVATSRLCNEVRHQLSE